MPPAGFGALLRRAWNGPRITLGTVVWSHAKTGIAVATSDDPGFLETADSGSGLAVSATGPTFFSQGNDNFRRPASYSNFGDGFIDVAAPGGDFVTFFDGNPLWFLDMVLSTCRGRSTPPSFSFCFAAGTSMASPAAAGVAALIQSANPGISLGALKTKLFQTADDEGDLGHDAFYGHGFVNAFRGCTE